MKRSPSLHIDEKTLVLVIDKLKDIYDLNEVSSEELAQATLELSKGFALPNRSIHITNERLEKKADIIIKANKNDTNLLAGIIYSFRVKKKHKGIKRLNQGDKDWGQLKKLTKVCIEFCKTYNLEKREGFIKYIEIALGKISSYRQVVGKMLNMEESIFSEYEVIKRIEDDPNPQETRDIHDYYVSLIAKNTGILTPYLDKPTKYIYFIDIKEETDKLDIPYTIYIDSQFKMLEWASSFPEPNQMVGPKAQERLNKYLYENKIRIKEGKSPKKDKVSFLKNLVKNGNNRDKQS